MFFWIYRSVPAGVGWIGLINLVVKHQLNITMDAKQQMNFKQVNNECLVLLVCWQQGPQSWSFAGHDSQLAGPQLAVGQSPNFLGSQVFIDAALKYDFIPGNELFLFAAKVAFRDDFTPEEYKEMTGRGWLLG